jgi:F1F0 ATPase subunit 2
MMNHPIVAIGLGVLAGMLLGSGYFAALYHCLRLQTTAARRWPILLLHVLRLGAALGVFWALAQLGARPLIGGLLGFLIARVIAQRLVAEA